MENSGYRVTCLDLKASGLDPTDPNTVLSFDDYNKPLIDFLSSLHDNHQGVPDLSEFGEVKEDTTLAAMLLRPGPVQALTTARFVESEDADDVPRIFIKTMHDNVVKPEQQEAMIKKWPPSDVYVLESDHSPFFSAPFLLFGLLVKAAVVYGC
ncbi:UNVERIFIED_CONTAM: Methylesterase 17 [Sesamum radiatum]|uniref:Methylesterase 17 n=1 Tax=Sesamum radiatum TaxID=300843 RepID=A0AAW2TEL4_SESRA